MLFHLEISGKIMVAGHQANRNIWILSEKFLLKWAEKTEIAEQEGSRLQPVHVELFEDSASHRMVRVPVGVNQVPYSMNLLSLKAQADIFWSVEQDARSIEEERRPITDRPKEFSLPETRNWRTP